MEAEKEEPSEVTREAAVARFKKRMEQDFVEGKGIAEGMEYAGFWRRFVACLIDGLLLGFFGGIFVAIIGRMSPELGGWIEGVMGIVYVIAFWTFWGQTLGKMAMGVKIVKTDGSPIGFGRAILRYVGYIVSGIILCIGHLMIVFDDRKQGLHDKIAGTCVIRT